MRRETRVGPDFSTAFRYRVCLFSGSVGSKFSPVLRNIFRKRLTPQRRQDTRNRWRSEKSEKTEEKAKRPGPTAEAAGPSVQICDAAQRRFAAVERMAA
jgi:hypothetical protein